MFEPLSSPHFVVFCFVFFSHLYFPASAQAVVTGIVPSSPRFLPSIFIAHRVQQSHCSSDSHRVLLTHALALSASQFVHKKKSRRIYTSMHSAGLELTKLTYTRLEDNLIRHRGDRLLLHLAVIIQHLIHSASRNIRRVTTPWPRSNRRTLSGVGVWVIKSTCAVLRFREKKNPTLRAPVTPTTPRYLLGFFCFALLPHIPMPPPQFCRRRMQDFVCFQPKHTPKS